MGNFLNKLKLAASTTFLRPLFFSSEDMKKEWTTNRCVVISPIRPEFCAPIFINDIAVYPLDIALESALWVVKTKRYPYNIRPETTMPFKAEFKCRIELATTEQLYILDKSPRKNKVTHQSVTVRGLKNTKIMTNKFIPEWLGHELLHWAEWYYAIQGNEEFAYNNEARIGSLLNPENAKKQYIVNKNL